MKLTRSAIADLLLFGMQVTFIMSLIVAGAYALWGGDSTIRLGMLIVLVFEGIALAWMTKAMKQVMRVS